jgi:hypothetical protein
MSPKEAGVEEVIVVCSSREINVGVEEIASRPILMMSVGKSKGRGR